MPKKPPPKVNFTKPVIEALKPPADGREYVYDAKVPGLAVCTTHTGAKSFYLYRRINGKPERIRLGGFPDIGPDQARTLAMQQNGKIADGVNPNELRRLGRGEMTLGELWEHYLERHAKPHKKASSVAEDVRQWEQYLTEWKSRRLSEIRRDNVQSLHTRTGKHHGPYAANRLLALLSKMFNVAASIGLASVNPCRGVQKFKEKTRDRFIHPDEMRPFLEALKNDPDETMRDFFIMALFTGARRRTVQAMRWEDVNLERATWRITDTKNNEPQTVLLSPPAIGVLERRQKRRKKNEPFVFSGRGNSGHIEEPKGAWKRITEAAGIKDLRIHDLRRTLGSWQAAAGVSLPIIGKSLGHRSQVSTAIYARLDLDPVRASVESAAVAMLTAGSAKSSNKKGGR